MKANANPFSEAEVVYENAKSSPKINATKLKEKGISTSSDDQSNPMISEYMSNPI